MATRENSHGFKLCKEGEGEKSMLAHISQTPLPRLPRGRGIERGPTSPCASMHALSLPRRRQCNLQFIFPSSLSIYARKSSGSFQIFRMRMRIMTAERKSNPFPKLGFSSTHPSSVLARGWRDRQQRWNSPQLFHVLPFPLQEYCNCTYHFQFAHV